MTPRRFTTREKRIFALCIGVIFAYAGYNGIFIPLQQRRTELADKILQAQKQLRKNRITIQKAKQYDGQYQQILQRFKQTASDEKTMSSILAEIEQVANENNMRITEMKPQRVRRVDFNNNFSVSLTLDGTLKDILQFLYVLQANPHLFNVDEVRFDKISNRSANLKSYLIISKVLIP